MALVRYEALPFACSVCKDQIMVPKVFLSKGGLAAVVTLIGFVAKG